MLVGIVGIRHACTHTHAHIHTHTHTHTQCLFSHPRLPGCIAPKGFQNTVTKREWRQDVYIMENLFFDRHIARIFDLKVPLLVCVCVCVCM